MTAFGQNAVDAHLVSSLGYAVVKTKRGHASFNKLGAETAFVHIDGHPFLWAIEEMLRLAPKLRTIQVIPSKLRHLHSDTHLKLCRERGVEIQSGHHAPELVWDEHRNVNPFWRKQRAFLLALKGEQRALFDELNTFGFEHAQFVSRYFCLNGEEYLPHHRLAEQFGLSRLPQVISRIVYAVLHYLDPSLDVIDTARTCAMSLQRRVERLRSYVASADQQRKILESIGVTRLPEGLPLSRLAVYKALLDAQRAGKLAKLDERRRSIIELRFGLRDDKPRYQTLIAVAEQYGLSRERIRQIEARTLLLLGIDEDSLVLEVVV